MTDHMHILIIRSENGRWPTVILYTGWFIYLLCAVCFKRVKLTVLSVCQSVTQKYWKRTFRHLLNISKSTRLVIEVCLHILEWPVQSTVSTIPLLSYTILWSVIFHGVCMCSRNIYMQLFNVFKHTDYLFSNTILQVKVPNF